MLGLFCEEEDSKSPNIHFPFFRDRSNSKSRSTLTPARQNDAQLMYLRFAELGLEKESILYTRVGIPMYDLNLLIHNPSEYTSNANLMRTPETIAKLVHDQVMEQHTYLSIPTVLSVRNSSTDTGTLSSSGAKLQVGASSQRVNSRSFPFFDGLILVFSGITWVVGMQEEPAALFLSVLVIDESPRVVGTRFVNATPAWISIFKGCRDSTSCSRMEFPTSQQPPEVRRCDECAYSHSWNSSKRQEFLDRY